ncbi:hypothetical protein [Rosettibacter firmus]|uniref:hypothetical protein n=1 Tax=Rosettibacter firmus TaxID=3111522 RepID=UPI00336C230A
MDFTQNIYKSFLEAFVYKNFKFYTISSYLENKKNKNNSTCILLRHDVDRLAKNSLALAQVEHDYYIKGTYYFRVVPKSFNLVIMNKVAELGHEIGYHYEDVDLVIKKYNIKVKDEKDKEKIIDLAYESFCKNLEMLRRNFNIKTICMHGSPRSKFDNRIIWGKYDYKQLGIIGEPYYDIDFNEFAYFTDTGRRWNSNKYNVRDKVNSKFNFNFKTTHEIINNIDKLPNKILFTIHPERWSDELFSWTINLILQNIKNIAKRNLILIRKEK